MSTDGRLLAAVDHARRRIYLWSTETMKLVKEFAAHHGSLRILAFSPDGNTLASGDDDRTVKLWDVSTGEDLLMLEGYYRPGLDPSFLARWQGVGHAQRNRSQ